MTLEGKSANMKVPYQVVFLFQLDESQLLIDYYLEKLLYCAEGLLRYINTSVSCYVKIQNNKKLSGWLCKNLF